MARWPGNSVLMLQAQWGTVNMERPACFLGANDEELWEAVTCLLLGPNVFVAFVLTGVLK